METTVLSSKGQIIIPQAIRKAHDWTPGVEFAVIETEEGILLSPLASVKKSKHISIQSLIGCTNYKGRKKSLKQMEAGIAKGAKKRK